MRENIVTCPKCGASNPDGMMYCGYCRAELRPVAQQQQGIQPSQLQQLQYVQPFRARRLPVLIIVALMMITILFIAIVAAFLMLPRGVQINSWEADGYNIGVVGNVKFTINLTNYGGEAVTKSVLCTVVFYDGDSYSATKSVTLYASETKIIEVNVIVANFEHIAEINNEDWASTTCILIS